MSRGWIVSAVSLKDGDRNNMSAYVGRMMGGYRREGTKRKGRNYNGGLEYSSGIREGDNVYCSTTVWMGADGAMQYGVSVDCCKSSLNIENILSG